MGQADLRPSYLTLPRFISKLPNNFYYLAKMRCAHGLSFAYQTSADIYRVFAIYFSLPIVNKLCRVTHGTKTEFLINLNLTEAIRILNLKQVNVFRPHTRCPISYFTGSLRRAGRIYFGAHAIRRHPEVCRIKGNCMSASSYRHRF